MVLVLVPHGVFLRVRFLDHLVGHFFTYSLECQKTHTHTHTQKSGRLSRSVREAVRSGTYSVYFVEDLPLFVGNAQLFCRLDGASQLAGPDLQVRQVMLLRKNLQSRRKLEQRISH